MFFRRKQVRWSNASRWHRRVLWIFICVVALLALWGGLITQAADGDLDRSFGNGGKVMVQIAAQKRDFATAVAVQLDGRIVVGGELGDYSSNTNSSVLVRLNPNGNLDTIYA